MPCRPTTRGCVLTAAAPLMTMFSSYRKTSAAAAARGRVQRSPGTRSTSSRYTLVFETPSGESARQLRGMPADR